MINGKFKYVAHKTMKFNDYEQYFKSNTGFSGVKIEYLILMM